MATVGGRAQRPNANRLGDRMPMRWSSLAFAAVIASITISAWGAGMPDFGSKNFVPGAATPSYFTNESGALPGRATEATDDGRDDLPGSANQAEAGRGTRISADHRDLAARRTASHHASRSSRVHAPRLASASSGRGRRTAGHGSAARHVAARHPVENRQGSGRQATALRRANAMPRRAPVHAKDRGEARPFLSAGFSDVAGAAIFGQHVAAAADT